jgi:hypothetical protein
MPAGRTTMPNEPPDEPEGEHIIRQLDQAIDRLIEDIDRVEMRSAAWRAWLEPIPGYESAHHEFLLPGATKGRDDDRRRPC